MFRRVKDIKVGDRVILFCGKQVVITNIGKGWCHRSRTLEFKSTSGEEISPKWSIFNKEIILQVKEV